MRTSWPAWLVICGERVENVWFYVWLGVEVCRLHGAVTSTAPSTLPRGLPS